MSFYEVVLKRKRVVRIPIHTTEELITGFFWECCGKWSPGGAHHCLAPKRTHAK